MNIFEAANKPETFMNILTECSFREIQGKYRAKEHSSYAIYNTSKGWRFRAHNGDFNDKAHTPYSLLETINPSYEKSELLRLLASAANTVYVPRETESIEKERKEKKEDKEAPFSYSFVKTGNYENAKSVVEYYSEKVGNITFEELQSAGIQVVARYKGVSPARLFWAYTPNAENVKFKASFYDAENNKRKKSVWYAPNKKNNYVFGLNYVQSIPKNERKDWKVLILEGEDDVLCTNRNAKLKKICAITFGGVGEKLQKSIIEELRKDFGFVGIAFDTDEAGQKGARKNENEYLLPIVEFPKFDGKDICDMFASLNKNKGIFSLFLHAGIEKKLDDYEKKTSEHEKRLHNIVINLIKKEGRIEVKRFVSEAKKEILSLLDDTNRLFIKAETGLGKTHFIINDLLPNLKRYDCEKLIICVPRKPLGQQLADDLNSNGVGCDFINGTTVMTELAIAAANTVIVTTVDSIAKVNGFFGKAIVVCDEPQKLVSDTTFRNASENILQYISDFKKTIFISATPHYLAAQLLDFQLISIVPTQRKRERLTDFIDVPKGVKIVEALMQRIETAFKNGHTKVICMRNNESELELLRDAIDRKSIVLSSAKCAEFLGDSAKYAEFLQKINDCELVLTTSIVDAGVNFKFDTPYYLLDNTISPLDCVQLCGRGRISDNSIVEIVGHFSEKTTKKETTHIRFEDELRNALSLVANLNSIARYTKAQFNSEYRRYFENDISFFYNLKDNEYQLNAFSLVENTQERPQNQKEYFDMLRSFDNSFSGGQTIELRPNEEVKDTLENLKDDKEDAKQETKLKVIENISLACEIVKYKTKSPEIRREINRILPPSLEKGMSSEAVELLKSCDYDTIESSVFRYLQMRMLANELNADITNLNYIALSDAQYKRLYNVLLTQYEFSKPKKDMTAVEIRRNTVRKALKIAVSATKSNRNRGKESEIEKELLEAKTIDKEFEFTEQQLLGVFYKTYGKTITFEKGMERLREVFQVEMKKIKKEKVYIVGKTWKVSSVLELIENLEIEQKKQK